jgi:hypothetical protein
MGSSSHAITFAATFALQMGPLAAAQTLSGGLELRVTNVVSPAQPTTNIEVWAWWDPVPANPQVFGAANLDLVAQGGEFIDAWRMLSGCGTANCGYVLAGSRINEMSEGQLHLPQLGIIGKRDNPIHILTGVWTTTDFSRVRTVGLHTENSNNFILADWTTGATTQLYPQGFLPGGGVIQVVPAPAAGWTVCTLVLVGARRQRARSVG